MATLFVRHDVADFAAWKKAYDDFNDERTTMGVTGDGVYQVDGNPDSVIVYHHFDSMDVAKAFVGSDRVREVMAKAGVQGEPIVWFATRV